MPRFCSLLFAGLLSSLSAVAADDWQSLFNGKDLTGWRANVMPKSFSVVDGAIRVNATKESAHLFYVGDLKDGFVRFKNFELEATCRSETNSNSGIFIHTDMTTRDKALHLAKGYEIQLNSSEREKRKTGSLYAVVDLDKSPVDESQWFRVRIIVRDKRITIHLNGQQVVDYTEPPGVRRPAERAGRLLNPDGGGIALQAHDPKSIFYFKDIRIKHLP
ncbi:MAG: glycosyl hydrolase [Pedosphaera sp.]|nr:MAG: glycosyl hydrolase [Pedosphaera sp.]